MQFLPFNCPCIDRPLVSCSQQPAKIDFVHYISNRAYYIYCQKATFPCMHAPTNKTIHVHT